jgi:hypothetical protein
MTDALTYTSADVIARALALLGDGEHPHFLVHGVTRAGLKPLLAWADENGVSYGESVSRHPSDPALDSATVSFRGDGVHTAVSVLLKPGEATA